MENSVKSSFSRGILSPLKPLRCVPNQLHGMIGNHADLNLIFSFGGNILDFVVVNVAYLYSVFFFSFVCISWHSCSSVTCVLWSSLALHSVCWLSAVCQSFPDVLI